MRNVTYSHSVNQNIYYIAPYFVCGFNAYATICQLQINETLVYQTSVENGADTVRIRRITYDCYLLMI